MIARRGCDDPASALAALQCGDKIDPAAHLEGADGLMVFEFEIELASQ